VAAIEALGQATAAQEATRRATELAKALDATRSEVSTKAAELRHLNATLEQRVAQEIEERMQVEAALRQSQKMEAIGQLTGGIAHDFNNLLTGIIGSLDLMQTRIRQGRLGDLDRYVGAAMSSAQRAAALTHRLLAFSRRQPLDPKPLAANQLVAEMEDLLRRTLGPAISLEMVLAGGLWPTLCDPVQLESALLNLCINARDAMPDGGRLTVETGNAHLDDAYAATQQDVSPGQYVAISVTDTGTGMSPELVSRVFEPFFTTKPIGQGTGLGLSMVYGFAKQSEGHIRIYSEEGKGTTVRLYLPRHRGEVDEAHDDAHAAEMPRAEAGATVCVVEDEPVVRGLITEVLAEMGFRTVEAQDGPSGLKLLQSRRRIDLLITDVGLPGINGRQLVDQARQRRPGLKVLFITGYAENATLANGFLEPGMAMLTKPFAVDALMLKIRQLAAE
jgi:signal transduction histidine kinase/ActR/RegA family two-component response regulator